MEHGHGLKLAVHHAHPVFAERDFEEIRLFRSISQSRCKLCGLSPEAGSMGGNVDNAGAFGELCTGVGENGQQREFPPPALRRNY